MGRINVVTKGKAFEREIANLLTLTTNFPWKRVPNSGGLATSVQHPFFQGDIFTEHPDHKDTVIECKNWKQFGINSLYSKHSLFANAVSQTIKESKGNNWLLFIKANNKGIFLIYNTNLRLYIKELGFNTTNRLNINTHLEMIKCCKHERQ